jgi:HK97 family phage portal protein
MSLASLLGGIANRAPVPYVSRYGSLNLSGIGHGSRSRLSQLEMYDAVGTLHGVVSKLAATTSMVQWKLWRSAPSGLDEDREEVTTPHAAKILWDQPVPKFFNGQKFRFAVQQHKDLAGEMWWVIVRQFGIPVEMWPVRPDRMAPVPHATKFVAGYVYRSPDGEQVPLKVDDVIFVPTPSPTDIYRGCSPLGALAADLANDTAQTAWNASFYRNSANPGGIIKVDRRMQDDEWEELVNRWNQQHRGISNAGRVAVLEEADFIPVSYTQRDMQFVESRGVTKQAILDAYGFPKFALGDVDDVNRASAEASLALFAQTLTVPRLETFKGALNGELLPMFGATATGLEFDYENPVPADAETDNDTLTAQAAALVALVGAGFDEDEACDVVGLPRMKFSKPEPKIIQAPPGAPGGGPDDEPDA